MNMRPAAALALSCLAALLCACGGDAGAAPEARLASASLPAPAMRVPGHVEVLNGCGTPGAAEKMRVFLTGRGFDVLETGNAGDANYRRTMVAVRTPGWEGTNRLAAALRTDRVVTLINKYSTVDATVFIGHDFQEIIAHGKQ